MDSVDVFVVAGVVLLSVRESLRFARAPSARKQQQARKSVRVVRADKSKLIALVRVVPVRAQLEDA